MEKVLKLSNLYVATLRQMVLTHQFSHWTSRGDAFYADHLVFERIYNSVAEDADTAAEKMIGLFGLEGVDYNAQKDFMNQLANRYADLSDDPVQISLKAEKDFLQFSKEVYKAFDDEGALSLGLDDMIMSIASNRESACYLLQQISE